MSRPNSQADIKEVVASLRECVLGQRWPAWGPIIICCVHSANHSTLPLTYRLAHTHTQTLLMCDICLGERGRKTPKVKCMNWKNEQWSEIFPRLDIIWTKIGLASSLMNMTQYWSDLVYESFFLCCCDRLVSKRSFTGKILWYTGSDVFYIQAFIRKRSMGSGSQRQPLDTGNYVTVMAIAFHKQKTSERCSAKHMNRVHMRDKAMKQPAETYQDWCLCTAICTQKLPCLP